MKDHARHGNAKTTMVLLLFLLLLISVSDCIGQTVLFQDDFGNGNADRWQLESGWRVKNDNGNYVLSGSTHSWARIGNYQWPNFRFKTRVKLVEAGSAVHLNYRTNGCNRYFVGFTSWGVYLNKTYPCPTHTELTQIVETHNSQQWYDVEIAGNAGNIKVYIDGALKIDYMDNDPVVAGSIAFEVLSDSPVYFDDVQVVTDEPVAAFPWVSTGGPIGGLGYDVRIHPANKNIMYVTDNWAGVAKSTNSGQTWEQTNSGITVKGGTTGDAVNIFSLTIDPNNNDTLWAGTFGEGSAFGVFKSTDGGSTWIKKTKGIGLGADNRETALVFRGFTIQKGNSDIVYAQAEVSTTVNGLEFNRVKGRVFKTTDGGENWQNIWQGDNLARYLIIDPANPQILYLSTGIFDREAFNSDCQNGIPGGEGVLKSVNGGLTWFHVNTGLTDLYVGSLRMHPTNPQILFAAAGNNACSNFYSGNPVGGLFKTINGAGSWTKVISEEIITTVNFSDSAPNTIYAGGFSAFFRSGDGGETWSKFQKPNQNTFGPRGVQAGFPIDVIVDPDIPTTLYVNNYGGGVIRSRDGAETWESWSKGYSGADIHEIHIPVSNPSIAYAVGINGPFTSSNYGKDWVGIANGDAALTGGNSVAANPSDAKIVLITDQHQGVIQLSTNGGNDFTEVLRHPNTNASDPNNRQGFRGLAFSSLNPKTVYAGLSKDRNTFLSSATTGTVIYKSQDGGATFSPIPSILDGHNVRKLVIAPNNANIVYAATTNGVYKTTDGGANWAHMDSLGNRKIEALAINPQQPGYIIAGEIFGGIWVTTDGGTTWAGPLNSGFSSPNPYISSLAVDPVNPDTVFAADLYSGIYRSLDKGHTWASFPDWKMSGLSMRAVKDIAVSKKVMYAATQGGGVFRFDRLYGLSINTSGSGTGSVLSTPAGIDCGNSCHNDFDPGTSVKLTATPAAGSTFTGWSGACTGKAICEIEMDQARNVTATFADTTPPAVYSVTPIAEAGCGITPATVQTVNKGSIINFTLTPVTGYGILNASGCGGIVNGNIYTTGTIISDCTVTIKCNKLDDTFSESAYLAANPDVAAAVRAGWLPSGWAHYSGSGKSEGRQLAPVGYGAFNEQAYLIANPDVAAAIKAGWLASGWQHYNSSGKSEGRPLTPANYANYDENAYLAANPDVALAVKNGILSSGWRHYSDAGRNEGRPLSPANYGSFTEEGYLAANPDVAAAIRSGWLISGWQHYNGSGKSEGRAVQPVGYTFFSETAYLAANPDVASAVKSGILSSGWQHYTASGKNEGRPMAPANYANFSEYAYLAANPDVAAVVRSGGLSSGWAHYSASGTSEGRPLNPTAYGSFDETAYLAANPDVYQAMQSGVFLNGWAHYSTSGKSEGRKLRP